VIALVAAACMLGVAAAHAEAAPYTIDGGTWREQAQVRAALEASAFDWSVLPGPISVQIGRGFASCGSPGHVYLDANLLDAGRFSWGVVQHEFAHQVDFLLLDDASRERLQRVLGGDSWWGAGSHGALTGERFASTLAWAYWPVPDNVMRPDSSADEAGAIGPRAFRTLLEALLLRQQVRVALRR
jgi:hypothetical protein